MFFVKKYLRFLVKKTVYLINKSEIMSGDDIHTIENVKEKIENAFYYFEHWHKCKLSGKVEWIDGKLVADIKVSDQLVPSPVQQAIIKYLKSYDDIIISPCDKSSRENALATPCMGVIGTDVSVKARRLLIEELKPFFEITR